MSDIVKPDYGNWVPRKMLIVSFIVLCISCVLSVVISIGWLRIFFIITAVLSGLFFVYIVYAYWLLMKNDSEIQKNICNTLLDTVSWDGTGKALDIGTGSGRLAIAITRRFPSASVTGVDLWGNLWTYSRDVCNKNADIEGVADRVSFQTGGAENLPFEDGEFDLVISNYVFHAVKVLNKNRTDLMKEALRVLKDGGVFAFQDLYNKQFYGDMELMFKELETWGLKELGVVDTLEHVHIPIALRLDHMVGGSKIVYGIK
ncbi:MAG: class I SAM-dependent methyltransferase [Dehalococcoidales bacterium]|nr:class I SAM-dependent methyltransferase [Dehalococcoidales bacterium]